MAGARNTAPTPSSAVRARRVHSPRTAFSSSQGLVARSIGDTLPGFTTRFTHLTRPSFAACMAAAGSAWLVSSTSAVAGRFPAPVRW